MYLNYYISKNKVRFGIFPFIYEAEVHKKTDALIQNSIILFQIRIFFPHLVYNDAINFEVVNFVA